MLKPSPSLLCFTTCHQFSMSWISVYTWKQKPFFSKTMYSNELSYFYSVSSLYPSSFKHLLSMLPETVHYFYHAYVRNSLKTWTGTVTTFSNAYICFTFYYWIYFSREKTTCYCSRLTHTSMFQLQT